jgi:hypothetical protein
VLKAFGMHECADHVAGGIISVDTDLEREFEVRLVESSTLAVRVAYSVLRNHIAASGSFVSAARSAPGSCG